MKKFLLLSLLFLTISATAQFRWELSGGLLFSKINLENSETSFGTGFVINGAYEYLLDQRARTGLIFAIEYVDRKSVISALDDQLVDIDIDFQQIGFMPKFRYYFGKEVRPYVSIGPSFRYTVSGNFDGEKLENGEDADGIALSNEIMLGATGAAGVVINIGERFFFTTELGVAQEFLDVLRDADSKIFDIYARVGIRYRPR